MKKNITIENRKAKYDYFIEETLECGIELIGNEVKSIKNGNCSIVDAYCKVVNRQLYIYNMFIKIYETTNKFDTLEENRDRKLLAHKKEIIKLDNTTNLDGMTLIPLKIYDNGSKIKVLVGVCKGKHTYDKRNSLKEKQLKREIDRNMKG